MLRKRWNHTNPNNKSILIVSHFWGLLLGALSLVSLSSDATNTATPQTNDHQSKEMPQIAIIIDDIGDNLNAGKRAIALDQELTYSFLPHTQHAKQLAELAHSQDKEVMLHLPMSSMSDDGLGPGALTSNMSETDFENIIASDIKAIPYASGVNNHMGSLLTQQPLQMRWFMQALKKYDLFFVDSRTTAHSVALEAANKFSIKTLERDIFLDDDQGSAAIQAEFVRLIAKAKQQGIAIGIGHPHQTTLDFLQQQIPKMKQYGVRLQRVSRLLPFAAQQKNIHLTHLDENK